MRRVALILNMRSHVFVQTSQGVLVRFRQVSEYASEKRATQLSLGVGTTSTDYADTQLNDL